MIEFGEMIFHESEVLYMQKAIYESKLNVEDSYPYGLTVHLRSSGLNYTLCFRTESDRDNKARNIANQIDRYYYREDDLKSYITSVKETIDGQFNSLSKQFSMVSYRLNDIVNRSGLVEELNNLPTELLSDCDPIDYLELSVRSYNCLKRSGVSLIGDLRNIGIKGLPGIRNLGKRSIDEIIIAVLNRTGVPLK